MTGVAMGSGDTPGPRHKDPPRTTQGRYTQRPGTAERDAQACRLRVTGATYDQIADALGFHDRGGARRAVQRALTAVVREPAEELLSLELARLDELTRKLNDVLEARHYVVTPGGRIVAGPDGQPLVDHGAIVATALALLRVHGSRRKLLGTDAPARARIEVLDDEVLREIEARMEDEIVQLQVEAARPFALPSGHEPHGLEATALRSAV